MVIEPGGKLFFFAFIETNAAGSFLTYLKRLTNLISKGGNNEIKGFDEVNGCHIITRSISMINI